MRWAWVLKWKPRKLLLAAIALDILARDVENNRPVVIENQLGATDHSHLGQLLTYAAGFDANVIVWIARNFRDEHREALDLLNRRTGEDTEFFGIEVELWRIDDSRPAVNFQPRRNAQRMAQADRQTVRQCVQEKKRD